MGNPSLWLVGFLSGSLYGTRAIFLLYANEFLAGVSCTQELRAGTINATQVDFCEKHAAACLFFPIIILFAAMYFLSVNGKDIDLAVGIFIVGLVGMCLFGPYKILGSVWAKGLGGKEFQGIATAIMGVFDNFAAWLMITLKGGM